MSPWLFIAFMVGTLWEMRVRWGDSSVILNHGVPEGKFPQLLYVDDAVLFMESEVELDRMVGHFHNIYVGGKC